MPSFFAFQQKQSDWHLFFFPTLPQAVAAIEPWTARILFLNSVGKTKDELLGWSSWQLLLLSVNYANLDILSFQAHLPSGTPLLDFHILKSSVALISLMAKPKLFILAFLGPSWSDSKYLLRSLPILAAQIATLFCTEWKHHILLSTLLLLLPHLQWQQFCSYSHFIYLLLLNVKVQFKCLLDYQWPNTLQLLWSFFPVH